MGEVSQRSGMASVRWLERTPVIAGLRRVGGVACTAVTGLAVTVVGMVGLMPTLLRWAVAVDRAAQPLLTAHAAAAHPVFTDGASTGVLMEAFLRQVPVVNQVWSGISDPLHATIMTLTGAALVTAAIGVDVVTTRRSQTQHTLD